MDPSQPVTGSTLETLLAAPLGSLTSSYLACQQIARARAGNFYYSFLILPRHQRLGMCALYAFMRVADDLADEEAPVEVRRQGLLRWREELQRSLNDEPRLHIYHALADTVKQFGIPHEYLLTLLDGVTSDLEPARIRNWTELRNYCYQVASVVGLCCVRIWGGTDPRTIPMAEAAGVAFQLTNILRDVASDARCGRVYLPEDLLREAGCSTETILKGDWNEAVRQAMKLVAEQAQKEYQQAQPLNGYLPASGRAVWGVMMETYQGLLHQIIARQYLPTGDSPRTSPWRKLSLLLRALPVRWGWKEAV